MNRPTNLNKLNDNGMRISNPDIKQRRIANPPQRALRQLAVLAAMMAVTAGTAFAQSETVTVGTGTSGTYYAPVCNYYTYGRSASIYTASEIGQAGCITQIEWYCNSNNQSVTCSEFKIYLTTTSNETFSNSNSFPTSATNVYSRTTSMTVGGATGWKSFTLDEPFFYNGTDNLIIIVTAKTSRYNTSLTWRYSTKSNSTVYYGNDNTSSYGDFGTNSITGRIDNRPNIRLTFKKFYFSATATANAGGSASVSPTTTNVIGTTSCSSATTTATFTATPNTGYRFIGWSTTSDGTPVSTANPYVATITSTSTNSGSPTNTTLYAQFEQIPEVTAIAADVEDVSVCTDGTATFSYTLTPADAYDNVTATSGTPGVATVSKDGHTITVTGVTAGSATITLSAAKLGGGAPVTTTVDVTVAARCAAPTIGAYDNATGKVTITPAASTIVYYTTNGDDPTNGSTAYTEPIDVTAPVTIKAVAYRDGYCPSTVASRSIDQVTTPTIEITGTSVTFSGANAGATYYYDLAGGDPTTLWDGAAITSGLTTGVEIKVIAKMSGMLNSETTTKTYYPGSGVDGTTVYLNDLEDHSWSYYSDATCPIRSLNPADVKITYYGNGIVMVNDNDYTASSVEGTNYIRTGNAKYVGGAKVNVGDEDENTFVYYKTLERGDATDATWTFSSDDQSSAASRCPYTPIPNPFQVRPTYGSRGTTDANNFTGWRGFQCWRLKSVKGGAVYSAASGGSALSTGAVINAETEIYFAPNAEYGMEVVLEAVWARAYLIKGNNGNENSVLSQNVGVERNFMTLTSNGQTYKFNGTTGRRITNLTYPVTISCYYPNGEAPDYTTSTVRGNDNNITLLADTKFENVGFYSMTSYTLSANGHNLIVGRGCSGGSTVGNVKGHTDGGTYNTPNSTNLNYSIRLESGIYNNFALIECFSSAQYYSGRITVKGVFGSDYDRAKNDNDKLHVAPDGIIYACERIVFTGPSNKDQLMFDWNVKSGSIQENLLGNANADVAIYMGGGTSYGYMGKKKLLVEGGEMASIAGGIDSYNTSGTYVTNADTYVSANSTDHVHVRITNNPNTKVRGAIYGAAAFAGSRGGRKFVITGGTINGWIAGGCNGTQSSGGQLYGATNIYIGGNSRVKHADADPYIGGYNLTHTNNYNQTIQDGDNGAYGGNIFGAGCGIKPYNYDANNPGATLNNATVGKVYGSNIALADNVVVSRDVYGGGNFGQVADNSGDWSSNNNRTSNIYILGGNVKGNVFGGSNNQAGQTVNINMTGGLVEGGIYGGSNTWGTISNNVTLQIDGGQVGTSSVNANIYGGGKGEATRVNGNVTLTLGTCGAASGVTVYGDVYGGSAMGKVNDQGTDKTTVSLYKGTIYGGLYGGGYGPGGEDADVEGAVQVNVFGGSVLCSASDPDGEAGTGSVFGCNNVSGTPRNSVKVDIYNTDQVASGYALHAVYGGGNKAPYEGTPVVTIHGCNNKIEYVYGGGNATDVEGTSVTIWGGTIGNAFGGGNGYSVTKNHNNASAPHYNPGANITIYGTHLNIYGGTVLAAFGGSNQYGTITGGVEVNVEPSTESNTGRPDCVAAYTQCAMYIGELYGGGNEAALVSSHNPDNYIDQNDINVNISCEAVVGMLFGGAKAADYVGDINLVVDGGHFEKVFGGNNKGGTITGNVSVTFNGGSAGEVYGGCNEKGTITGGITVDIDSTNTTCTPRFYVENVYGGGNLAAYTGSPLVNIKNGTVQQNVYGGGFGSTAIVTGTPVVTVGVSDAGKTARVWGHVFGGGNAAAITGNTSVNILYNSLVKGHVFGGGNAASVSTDTFVLVRDKAKVFGNIYGGGNQGEVGGNSKVVVNGDRF